MNSTMIIACLLVVIILVLLFEKIKNKRVYELLKQFPSYRTYPLIGNLLMLRGSSDDYLAKGEKLMAPYDRLVFWVGPVPCLVLKKYDDIVAVLSQSQHRETLNLLGEWVGTGILNAEYAEWKKSRKLLTPAFSSEMLTEYANIFNRNALKLIERLRPAADQGETVDVWDYIINTNVDSILANTLGKSVENTGTDAKNYCDSILKLFESITKRVVTVWLYPRIFYLAYLNLTGKINTVNHLKDFPTKVLSDKLKLQNSEGMLPDEDDSSSSVIDLIMKKDSIDDSFNETRIRDEILQLISTGAETTALNICFTLLMLAINQDIQQKVYEDVVKVMPTEDDTLTAAIATNNLKYVEQCIKETSRVYSQATLAFRRTHKDCLLSDNKIVPSNTFVVAALHLVHYDAQLYDNPSNWDPEHFNDQAVSKRPKGSELIFGYGPRFCIGAKYSIISSKTQIAHIIRNYHLSTNVKKLTKDNLKADLCVRSKIGYPIKFTRRQDANP